MTSDTSSTYATACERVEREASERYYQDGPPNIDLATWRLEVSTRRDTRRLNYTDILELPQVTQDRRFVCVCAWSIRQRWSGVLLADVLSAAGADVQALIGRGMFLRQESVGHPHKRGPYVASISLDEALDRGALVCHSLDGKPLTPARGFPVRLVDFGLYGYKCVKGLAKLGLVSEPERGWWEQERNYPEDGTIRPKRYNFYDVGEMRLLKRFGEVDEF